MSAFICSAMQVAVVARTLVGYESNEEDAVALAKELGKLNVKSVAYRYHTDAEGACQDFVSKSYHDYLEECEKAVGKEQGPYRTGRLLGIVSSFLYQSCESDECFNSALYQRVKKLEDSMEDAGVRREGWSL